MLHKGCSTKEVKKLLLSRSTWKFKKSQLLQMHFELIVANWNQKTRIEILSILKLLYTGCSTKEAISLFPSWTKTSRINAFSTRILGKCSQIKIKQLESGQYILKLLHTKVLHKRSNKTASFEEHLEVQEKSTFADAL